MKKFITFLVVLTTFLSTSYGQGGSVKGTVKDTEGLTLIGATVQVENTNTAVVTDLDGNYTLSNVPTDAVLIFSYVGMESQNVPVAGKGVIDVVLASDSSELEEVIIIGYGTTTKRKSVGAVSAIESEKIESSTYSDIQTALQGQVPGLFVSNSGAGMGSVASVRIRGSEGEPLYVIDGVISSAQEFSMLNPSDVETMSFLKDASSTAVYGSKAGNGIVLVQTKQGDKGDTKVNYTGSFQVSEPTMIADRMNAEEWMTMNNDVAMRETGKYLYDEDAMNSIGENWLYPDNHWPSMIWRSNSFQQKHNLGLSGAVGDTKYYAAVGHYTDNGLLKSGSDHMSRTNMRTNVISKIDKLDLTFNASMNASLQNATSVYGGGQAFRAFLYQTAPNQIAFNPDGSLANTFENPMLFFSDKNNGYTDQDKLFINAKVDLTWAPKAIEGLSAGVMASLKNNANHNRNWMAYPNVYDWDSDNNVGVSAGNLSPTSLTVSNYNSRYVDLEARVSYVKKLGKHTLDGLLLYTQRTTEGDNLSGYRTAYTTQVIDQLNVGPQAGWSNSGTQTIGGSQGLVFRAKYDYADKYIVEFSGRYDGNDDFAEGHRWGFFPSVSGVWIVSDEPFMQSLNDRNIINFFKLRGSYGETGITVNDARFAYNPSYKGGDKYYVNGDYVTTWQEGDLVDPANLSWYTRKSTSLGADVAFAGNKFQATLDYFFYQTTGFLSSPDNVYSTTLGASLPLVISDTNHQREGYEFSLTYKNQFGDWRVMLSANMSKYNQLYTQLDTENDDVLRNPYKRTTGRTDYSALLYYTNGFYQNTSDLLSNPRYYKATDQELGDTTYQDLNGDGQITEQDMRMLDKPATSHLNYGISFNVGWKNLSLSGLFQGVGTRNVYLGDNFAWSITQRTVLAEQMDFWSEDNRDARFPIVSSNMSWNNNTVNDLYIENAKYLRLKNLALTYDLKKSLLKNSDFINGLSVSLSGTNLLTWSPFFKYADPEAQLETFSNDKLGTGNSFTASASPILRAYSLGINLTF